MGTYADHLPAAIAIQLGAELDARGMDRKDLAAAAGLGINSVSRYLNYRGEVGPNARKIPLDTFALLCDALGVDPAIVMERAMQRVPKQ